MQMEDKHNGSRTAQSPHLPTVSRFVQRTLDTYGFTGFGASTAVDLTSSLSGISFPPLVARHNVPGLKAKDVEQLLSNIHPDGDIKANEHAAVPLLVPLMEHQKASRFSPWLTIDRIGMDAEDGGRHEQRRHSGRRDGSRENHSEVWLAPLRAHCSIALMVSRPSKDPGCKTTLICTPVGLLRQWYDEIREKTNPPLSAYIHHSSWRGKKAETAGDLLQYDVVLTPYDTIVTNPSLRAN